MSQNPAHTVSSRSWQFNLQNSEINKYATFLHIFLSQNLRKMLTSISIVSLLSYFLLGVIGWITYKIFIWPYYVSPLRKIPGPPSENPILGNIKSLMSVSIVQYF
jgi:hypothetical protein